MSVLGRSEIITRLRSGSLIVSPILYSDQVGAASVDMRMGNVVLVVRSRGESHVDPIIAKSNAQDASSHKGELGKQQKHQRYDIPFKSKFLLHPGSLALVPTLEWVKLPNDLIGIVTARSTWAREGLSIATATLIEARYQGIVTLELANLGEIPIALYPGMSLAQIAFSVVEGDTARPGRGQFEFSFEPSQGKIVSSSDRNFVPDRR